MKVNRMFYSEGQEVNKEFDEDPQSIAEELDGMFRHLDNIVKFEEVKQANGKRIWQIWDKRRIVVQYKEL
jgi:hypothetical protein